MASRKENLKSLFTNTRTRIIIIFTTFLMVIAVVIGIAKFSGSTRMEQQATATLSNAPAGIRSIPGALNPTAQYAKLQEIQNVTQAQSALKSGGSAIPTIIRSQSLGEGAQGIGPQGGQGAVGFTTLAREAEGGPQQSLWIQDLKNNNCSKAVVQKVVTQGAVLTDLKAVCSCVQLRDNGYQVSELEQVCSCKELKAAGYNARQLKDAGYSASRLRGCGFDACALRNAGFGAQEMKDGGYSDGELKGAGFSDNDITKASGIPEGITEADIRNAGCQVSTLQKLRARGVSASAIRRITGCSAAQLKAAGYSAADLKNAGFSAAELRKAGFSPDELKKAGFSARDLLNAGFTPKELEEAGYTPEQIRTAEAELPPGISSEDVKKAGCDPDALRQERLAGVSAMLIKQYAGCSAKALKEAGFTDTDLKNAGFNPEQIKAAKPLSDNDIRAAGCAADKLRTLFKAGISAKRIHDLNGCSAAQLKAADYNANALTDAGFSPQELQDAGFSAGQLAEAGKLPSSLIAIGRLANCSVESLRAARAAGISAAAIKQTLGCSAAAMKAAGYTAKELKDAGYTAGELKDAGFSAADLKNAGFGAKELRAAGFDAAALKAAGFSAAQLKDAGFSADDLKKAGFTAAQLKAAGFGAKDLKDAGFTPSELLRAGVSPKDLKDAGFTANQMKNAGLTDAQLKDAGFAIAEAPPVTQVAGLQGMATPAQQPSNVAGLPVGRAQAAAAREAANAQQLQQILQRQNQQLADQRYQQQIQQRTSEMLSSANQSLQGWQKISTQSYIGGGEEEKEKARASGLPSIGGPAMAGGSGREVIVRNNEARKAIIKMGDVVFAVIDTSVNSDEPGPILATIVSGRLKGAKLIGSFTLPANASKMVLSFNMMSVPGAAKTTPISAYAIDPNTARTALSSQTNHHYLQRYGSLFASSFLEGFGNAFQSANTTVTIGGTGGGNNVTVQNGIGRSALQNAVIGLATLGKSWGQVAQQQFNRPTTVEIFSGTGVGILFTQDITSL